MSSQVKFHSYDPKSQITIYLRGLYNLYSVRRPLSSDPRFGKGGKKTFREKIGEKPHRRARGGIPPPGWTDIDVACTEQTNKITVYTEYDDNICDACIL